MDFYDDVDGCDLMLFDIYLLTDNIDEFTGHLTDCGCRWHQWTFLDYRFSQGVDCIGLSISFMHMWHMINYIMILFMDHWQCFIDGCRLAIAW